MSIKGPSRIDASSEICAAGTKPQNALLFNWKKNKTKKYISTLKKKTFNSLSLYHKCIGVHVNYYTTLKVCLQLIVIYFSVGLNHFLHLIFEWLPSLFHPRHSAPLSNVYFVWLLTPTVNLHNSAKARNRHSD